MDKIQSYLEKLPPDFWYKTVVFLAIVLGIVLAVRFYQKSNKLFLSMGILVVIFVLTFHWTYNRTEPSWATPVIESTLEKSAGLSVVSVRLQFVVFQV